MYPLGKSERHRAPCGAALVRAFFFFARASTNFMLFEYFQPFYIDL